MRKKYLLIGLIGLLLIPLTAIRATFDAGQIREVVSLTDYLGQFSPVVRPIDIFNNWEKGTIRTVDGASLSPDGAQIAWYGEIREEVSNLPTNAICTHTFAALETYCYLLPDLVKKPSPLSWSTDGQYVFFTGDRIESGQNVDLWVFSTARGLLLNVTSANALSSNVIPTYSSIAPTWDSFNNNLYFIRDLTQQGGATSWELHRIPAAHLETAFTRLSQDLLLQAGQVQTEITSALDSANENRTQRQTQRNAYEGLRVPSDRQVPMAEDYAINFTTVNALNVVHPTVPTELVGVVTGLPTGSRLIDTYRETLFAPSQIDLGGLMMALLINNVDDPNLGGLWLMDLSTAGLIPLATVENVRTIEPEWIQNITLENLQWTADNTGILFSAHVQGINASYYNIYHQSLLTMILDPVVKYNMVGSESEFFGGDISSRILDSAVLLPTSEILYFNRSMRDILYSVPVPPPSGGAEATIIQLERSLTQQRRLPASVGGDNHALRVVVDANLITLQQ